VNVRIEVNMASPLVLRTRNTEHVCLNELHDFILGARRGDTIVYARGEVARDIELCPSQRDAAELKAVRDRAYHAYEKRELLLTQRHIAINHFEYRATRV
jgi:hypothetical protein